MHEDQIDLLDRRIQALPRPGTLLLTDGVYYIGRPLILPVGVSLVLQPGAVLKALPTFNGQELVRTESYGKGPEGAWMPQAVEGGILDGSSLPITGVRTIRDRETDIRNLTIRNCTATGIHVGAEEGCEVNIVNVRIQCERGVVAQNDSIGIHYDKCTDSLVNSVVVIGYATGVRSDSSSNDFQQIHVWNYDSNCRLHTCFHCNGWNDSWNQCYADSPMNGDGVGYGFHVARPFNRITNGRVYNNDWTTPDKVIGIYIAPGGTHGTYIGNHFTARPGHRMLQAFGGNLEAATILGNSFNPEIGGGIVAQIPSGGGGLSPMPRLQLLDPPSLAVEPHIH